MEHPRIDDEQVVDRYLAGRLSSEDEALFEEHLFACGECLEKVQWGEELRRGLRAVATENVAHTTVSLSLLAWLRSRRPMQLAGLVGLALAFIFLPAVALRQQAELGRMRVALQELANRGAGLTEPTGAFLVVSLGVVRDGGGEIAEIRLDPGKETVLLSLELQTIDAVSYRVTLRDAADEVLWAGDGLEPNLYDTLLIALPSSFLAPGSYRITVEGLSAAGTEPAGEMEFRTLLGR